MATREFKLSELKLDQLNVRTGPQDSQRAALHALIAEREPYKIANLGKDIIARGRLSPGEPIWVTVDPDDAGSFIVLEGNRRVGALKMLENPALATGTAVAADFADLAKDFAKKPIRLLTAEVFADREEAQQWIDLRHMGATSGAGLQPWRSLAKERAKPGFSGRLKRSLLVLDYLDDDTEAFGAVGDVIEAKSSTVDRLLNNPAMKDVLGVSIDLKSKSVTFENGDEKAGRALLRDVIGEMAKPDFKFSDVRDEKDRQAFLGNFAHRSVRRDGVPPKTPAPPASSAAPASGGTVVAFPGRLSPPPRSTLAPGGKQRIAKVEGKRLNKLYRECVKIELDGNENAAALLLRVFIELSSEAYLIEKNVPIPAALATKRNVAHWSDHGATLASKVNAVLNSLDAGKKNKLLQPARVAVDPNSHAVASINTLHSYFHNLAMNPEPTLLREAWDGWESYLKVLHTARA